MQPPSEQQPQHTGRARKGIGAVGTVLAFLALKFKVVLAVLLQFKFLLFFTKFFAFGASFLLSLWFYVVAFGARFAIVIVLLLLAHELGHYFAFRAYGLPARLPVFVPFLGAFTAGAVAKTVEQDAYIALAGPLTGLGLAGVCYAIGVTTGDRFWLACADLSAFLNLFNMIPCLPFDGGRVIGTISPVLWGAGIALFALAAWYMHFSILIVIIVGLVGVPAMWAALKGRVDPRAAAMGNDARFRVGIWYLVTLLGLLLVMSHSHAAASSSGSNLL